MNPELIIIAPILIPFAAAVLLLIVRPSPSVQRQSSIAAMTLLVASSVVLLARVSSEGLLVTRMGGWSAPFGITLVADHLSALMLCAGALIGLATTIYTAHDIDQRRVRFYFYPLLNVLMGGIGGAFLAGDLFNLYVWFELLLISSFILMPLGNRPEQLEGALKYVVINLLGSMLLLAGIGILYGMTGTLNMADLARLLPESASPDTVTAVAMLFLAAFGIKAAVFPLFFWLPASYHTPPVSVSALFSGLLTKVGVYALIRMFTLLFTVDTGFTHTILLWIAGLTMLTGVLGAVAQNDMRRLLSFHIVSQIGYMIFGLALFTPFGLLAAVFFVLHNIFAKTNLFFVSGLIHRESGTFDIRGMGGLLKSHPGLSVLFLIPALALAGVPPLSGFWSKFMIADAGFQSGEYLVVGVSLFVGLLTLFSMSKIWMRAFQAPAKEPDGEQSVDVPERSVHPAWLYVPVVMLAGITVAMGLFAAPFHSFAASAANELMNPDIYIRAVLGP